MFYPVFNDTFSMRTTDSRWWEGGGAYMDNGAKTEPQECCILLAGECGGISPNETKYNESEPFENRVDNVVRWFLHVDINMVALYLSHEPDSTGHKYGPDSPEVLAKIKEMDTLLGYVVAKLEDNNLTGGVNVLVTSDHGMTSVDTRNRVIDIPNLINTSLVKHTYDSGPVMHFVPQDGKTDELYTSLRDVHPNMTVYRKEEIPDFWHYKHNRRVMPILGVADEGWVITMVSTPYRNMDNILTSSSLRMFIEVY
jgi:ectonucleotide pyrophosphatase/phosphodiesterase family protein 5